MPNRFLFCDGCLDFTWHLVEDKSEARVLNLKCVICGKEITCHIDTKRVKVPKEFNDDYVRTREEFQGSKA